MKRIYILTYHCAQNVGAMLQCYALSKSIENTGNKVTVIDYRPEKVCDKLFDCLFNMSRKEKIKKNIMDFVYLTYRFLKYFPYKDNWMHIYRGDTSSVFLKFMCKNIPLSDQVCYTEEELKENFADEDAIFITGSDQVWNPVLSETPKAYLLDFVKKGRKNAYAASFGKKNIDDSFSKMIRWGLSDFDIISVREESGIEIVKKYADKEAVAVLDPVFLHSKEEWKSLTYKVHIPKPYIFVYRMESEPRIIECVKKLKKANPRLKVVKFDYIDDGLMADYTISRKGPIDFISYLFGSSYVVTNSFHGTAFSVIANKEAYIVPHTIYNERISSLLNDVKIEADNRGIYELNNTCAELLQEKIHYSKDVVSKICNN